MAAMRVLVFGNRDDDDLGFVGEWGEPHRMIVDRRLRERDTGPVELSGYDLVISLGSVWSVYWPGIADRLAPEAAALKAAVMHGQPVLGICFGAQMLSAALGGEVTVAPSPEIGWVEIDTDLPDLVPPGPWMQWHIDRFTTPAGALEVARTESATQAFTIGRALAVQFHPEVDASIVKRWVAEDDDQLRANQLSGIDVIADAERNEGRARADTFRMLDAFWATIAGR